MASLRARVLRRLSAWYIKKANLRNAEVDELRRKLDRATGLLRRVRRVNVAETEVAGVKAEWLVPEDLREGKTLLYLHGGAYVAGNCDTHRNLVSHIARAARMRALLPNYRLAPEHRFPAAIDDAVAVYRALLADGVAPQDIYIGGDSAGGGLTAATLLSLRHTGDPMPAGAVMLSPFLDITASGETMHTRAEQDPWFDLEEVRLVASYYCKEKSEHTNPLVSPVFANVAGLPPVYIQVGDHEVLLSDATRFADKLEAAGGQIEIEVFPEMWHVFQMFVGKMPEARQAVDKIGTWLGGAAPLEA